MSWFPRSWFGLLNFFVFQWFGIRLAKRLWILPGNLLGGRPSRRGDWFLLRWVWPMTGWWSRYRWIKERPAPIMRTTG